MPARVRQVFDRGVKILQADLAPCDDDLNVVVATVRQLKAHDARLQRCTAVQLALEEPCSAAVDVFPGVDASRFWRRFGG